MTQHDRVSRVASLLALAFLLLACGGSGDDPGGSRPAAQERSLVRLTAPPFLSYAPYFIALDEGFFEEEGLEVQTLSHVWRETDQVAALARGDVDVIGGRAASALFNSMARGIEMRVVAARGTLLPADCPSSAVVARRELLEAGLDSAERLRGLRLQVARSTHDEFVVERALGRYGLTVEDFETVRVPAAVRSEALRTGAVHLAMEREPFVTVRSRDGVAGIWMPAHEVAEGFDFSFVVFGPRLLHREPEIGLRFLNAYLRAVRRLDGGKTEEMVATVAKHTGIAPGLLREACWPTFRPSGRIDVDSVVTFQRWAVGKGYQQRLLRAEEFWDPRFLDLLAGNAR